MDDLQFKYFGRINDPDGAAFVKGICGDEMEFYLVIKNQIIEDIRFYTNGCEHTALCGNTTAELVLGRRIDKALKISPGEIKEAIKDFPLDHNHCVLLSAITFYKALADYLYKQGF